LRSSEPFTAVEYDDETKTLVWTSSDRVAYGVVADLGEELWSYELPADQKVSMSDVFAAGSGIAVVGPPTLGRPLVLDIETGQPIDVAPTMTVLSAGPAGMAVVEDGELEVVQGAELA